MANPIIKQIKIGTTTYDIRDSTLIDGALRFLGISTTPITDGGKEEPTINGNVIPRSTLRVGDVVLYSTSADKRYQEFVWVPNTDIHGGYGWELLGDEGSYVIKGTYATQGAEAGGTISQPTFTGTTATISLSGTIGAQTLPVSTTTDTSVAAIDFSGTPSGTVSQPTFTGTTHGHTISAAAPGSGETANYTPAGSVSASGTSTSGHSFSGTSATITVTTTDAVTAVSAALSDTPTFTGTTHTFSPSKTTDTVVKSLGETTTTITVVSEVLNLPTVVLTAVSPTTISALTNLTIPDYQPAGTISKPTITVNPTKGTVTSTGTYTPDGSVKGAHSWTGTGVLISASDTQAGGNVGQPTFTGNTLTISKRLVAALAAVTINASGSYQPAGTVSTPTFTGTAHTHNITFS